MASERLKNNSHKNSALRKCFQALVDRKQVNINMDILKFMLKIEFQLNLESLDEQLASVLPFMLIVYIRNWPGWQKSKEYFSGNLNFNDWFLKFRQYIIVRLKFIIKNGYKDVMNEIMAERSEVEKQLLSTKSLTERGSQTDFLAPKGVAPFCVSIECSPKQLCSMLFTDDDDDIILSHHKEMEWTKIGLQELLNWPHVGVEFVSLQLAFKRFNRSQFYRFLNLTSCYTSVEKQTLIEEIQLVDPGIERKCYTLNLLWAYASQMVNILRNEGKMDSEKVNNIEIVIEEFFKDINEWGLNNTAATNTSVLFNIGNCSFTRNKKSNKTNKFNHSGPAPEIGYSETFTPKMETEFTYFKGIQDPSTTDVTFTHLNNVKKQLEVGKLDIEIHAPILIFYCLFCNIKYKSHTELLEHLELGHGMESNFICAKCLKSLTVPSLAKNRWKHICLKP